MAPDMAGSRTSGQPGASLEPYRQVRSWTSSSSVKLRLMQLHRMNCLSNFQWRRDVTRMTLVTPDEVSFLLALCTT